MREGFTVAFTNTASNHVRYRFEPRSVGGWTRYEEHFDTGQWRPVGEEIVCDVELEVDHDCPALEVLVR